jgi:hypothetical protein
LLFSTVFLCALRCRAKRKFPLYALLFVRWFWVFAGLFVACLLCVLPTIGYRPNRFVYAAGLFFPLLGLLLLNSKRHREMRSKLVEVRRQRELSIQAAKASRSRR